MDPRTNPYAPPRADAIDDVAPDATGTPTPFFAVTTTKLVVMSILTFSFYEIYWFYKNWKIIRDRTGQRISPFWRAVFQILFCYPLFKHVRDHEAAPAQVHAGIFAIGFIVVSMLWRLPEPYSLASFASV